MNRIIDISNDFSFSYGGGNILLRTKKDKLSLDQGSIYGIFGENGCGKTTFLNILTTQLKPSTGNIKYKFNDANYSFGPLSKIQDTNLISNNIRRCFQIPLLIDEWTVYENIFLAKRNYKNEGYINVFKRNHDTENKYISQILSTFRFSGYEKAEALSYGQRRLIANLQMLYCEAPLIILDEPFANLHMDVIEILQHEYKKVVERAKSTIVIVEHNQKIIDRFANRRISISNKDIHFID